MFLSMKAFSGCVWNHKFNTSSSETVWICSLNQFPPATDSLWLVVLLNYWVNECWAVYKVNDAWTFFFFNLLDESEFFFSAYKTLSVKFVLRTSETWFWESEWLESFPLVLWYMVCQHLLPLIHETQGAHCPSSTGLVILAAGSQRRARKRRGRKRG